MKIRKISAVLGSLALWVSLCGCGAGGYGEAAVIGRSGDETGANAQSAEAEVIVQGGVDAAGSTGLADSGPGSGSAAETAAREAASREIRVYVCGAVVSPGVVALPEDSRAEDALSAAGGFAEDAWRDYVNLAERVQDGEKLYFPTLDEKGSGSLPEQEAGSGLVNINTADVTALCALPGIGEARARDIIAYREAYGAFESCEDIMNVSGIKTSVYNKISDMITVR